MKKIEAIVRAAPVIPVLVIEELFHARPIAKALASGGLAALKALRSPFYSCSFCATGCITITGAPAWVAVGSSQKDQLREMSSPMMRRQRWL